MHPSSYTITPRQQSACTSCVHIGQEIIAHVHFSRRAVACSIAVCMSGECCMHVPRSVHSLRMCRLVGDAGVRVCVGVCAGGWRGWRRVRGGRRGGARRIRRRQLHRRTTVHDTIPPTHAPTVCTRHQAMKRGVKERHARVSVGVRGRVAPSHARALADRRSHSCVSHSMQIHARIHRHRYERANTRCAYHRASSHHRASTRRLLSSARWAAAAARRSCKPRVRLARSHCTSPQMRQRNTSRPCRIRRR
jgi:hypothetical protein